MASNTLEPGVAEGLPSQTSARRRDWPVIIGWVLSALVGLLLIVGAVMTLANPAAMMEGFQKYGYPASTLVPIAIVELVCAVLYLIPSTSVLGAILLAAYFGGAVSTHVRAAEGFVPAVVAGVLAWIALYLREPRLRALTPLRRRAGAK
jgi:cytochrome b subunit of formate dehydrogenase